MEPEYLGELPQGAENSEVVRWFENFQGISLVDLVTQVDTDGKVWVVYGVYAPKRNELLIIHVSTTMPSRVDIVSAIQRSTEEALLNQGKSRS